MQLKHARFRAFARLYTPQCEENMKQIPTIKTEDGSIAPSEPYPQDATLVVAGEDFYTCYQPDDALPEQP